MKADRRSFLRLLGLGAPAVALVPKIDPSTIPETQAQAAARMAALDDGGLYLNEESLTQTIVSVPEKYRFLGLAQLKNEGDPICFDPADDLASAQAHDALLPPYDPDEYE